MERDYLTWFEAIFVGEWIQVPADEPVPQEVLNDSREWATELLEAESNPYEEGRLLQQQMFLGLQKAPDKLVTKANTRGDQAIRILETLQQFTVEIGEVADTNDGGSRNRVMNAGRQLEAIWSGKAKPVVDAALHAASEVRLDRPNDAVVLLTPVKMTIGAIKRWWDQVSIFQFAGKLYVDFPKTYPGFASPTFTPGLNWYPSELRSRLGRPRSD